MASTTLTVPDGATNARTDPEKYARVVKFIRNMTDCKRSEDSKVVVPVRTISNPSPPKKAASNRHPGQTHTRTEIDGALTHELAMARYLMHDLADHVFGHIVSTELARDILQKFIQDKVVKVFEGPASRNNYNLIHPESDDARSAIQQAFERADYYDCIKPDTQTDDEKPADSSGSTTGKGKRKEKTYSFTWTGFPTEPLREDDLVIFLNDITDLAFDFAKLSLTVANPKLRHRFATPEDKHHTVPLSYEADGEDMRPDFLLLPIEAFSDDFKTVDSKYVNFTASRLVGESKNKDLAAGVEQMQRYARGLKRAQPWVYYVLGLTITKDKAMLLRGEGSGTERLEIILTDGRGCIEFIRILLGLALADKVDLGHNPDVVLGEKKQACKSQNVTRRSNMTASRPPRGKEDVFSVPNHFSRVMSDSKPMTRARSASAALRGHAVPSSSTKRVRPDVADDGDEVVQSKKRKTDRSAVEEVDRFIFYPVTVYGHECLGILFTASSIRGRGTTVFCVVDLTDDKKLLALKMAWQDLGRVEEQDRVMKHLNDQGSHRNVIVPIVTYNVQKDGKMCTTLGEIRGFLDDQIGKLDIENRVLTISISELKRPVKYFWGVHDFVRGLRGALLGHEYLTKIGVLHRDISENNIVLGLRPEDERGYLIDLDMAILQNAEQPTKIQPSIPVDLDSDLDSDSFSECTSQKSSQEECLLQSENKKPIRALRTGTFPYISYNVLWGGKHTQFDDVESFLYVLLLFFFSYAGPLPISELRKADGEGFVHPIGSGRLPHMRSWPKMYAAWADGDPMHIARQKHSTISSVHGAMRIIQSTEFRNCLENNWPEELHRPIAHLIEATFKKFYISTLRTVATDSRSEVSHTAFISTLDKWLQRYSHLEDKFSNCPFKHVDETEES